MKKIVIFLILLLGLGASVFLVSRSQLLQKKAVPAATSSTLYFLHQDQLGSSSLVTDASGVVVARQTYYPYGTTRSSEGDFPTQRQYTGQVSDTDETGLYYYNARYYNPTIGKFTQADIIQDNINRYAYVKNNPINITDPLGLQGCSNLANEDLARICLMAENLYFGLMGTGEMNSYEKRDFHKAIIQKLFGLGDPENPTTVDLMRYRAIYEGMEFFGGFFDRPLSSTMMFFYLHSDIDDLDISNLLAEAYESGLATKISVTDRNFKIKSSENGRMMYKIITTMREFFPNLTADYMTAFGRSTYLLESGDIFKWVVDGEAGMVELTILNPTLNFYDKYDWDQSLKMPFDIPFFGEISLNDRMGFLLAEADLANPFTIHGNLQLKNPVIILVPSHLLPQLTTSSNRKKPYSYY